MILRKIYRRSLLELSKLNLSSKAPKIESVDVDGFSILARVNEDVGRIMKLHGDYEVPETNFFRRVIKPDDVCFDVGGNIGYFAILFGKISKDIKVHCFEPIALNARLIEASAALNSLENVLVNTCAVGAVNGMIEFVISEDSAYSSIIDTGRRPRQSSRTVPLLTLDHYVAQRGIETIDILKIDVEGAEADVIRGANAILTEPTRRPRYIMIELADTNLVPFGENVEGVLEMITALGYIPHSLGLDGGLSPLKPGDFKRHYNFVFAAS